ncbi:MAG TPA: ATP-binding protein [Acidimicrobiales bacterium]|nr:ATP-binding protein [Acidimicrobiales bacterium]
MLRAIVRWRMHWITLVVLLLGLTASVGSFIASSISVTDTNGQLLRQDTAQTSLLITVLFSQTTQEFQALGATVSPTTGPDVGEFDFLAGEISKATGGGAALLHESGGRLAVVSSVGHLHRSFNPSTDAMLAALAKEKRVSFPGVQSVGHTKYLDEIGGAGFAPAGYIVYVEEAIAGDITAGLSPLLFTDLNVAVYVGSVAPSNFVAAKGRAPTGDQVALSPVQTESIAVNPTAVLTGDPRSRSYPGQLVIAASAQRNLTGAFAANFPKILFFGSLLATLIVTALVGTAIGRRDEALGFVATLRDKNSELDEALTRQAQAEQSLRQAQRMEAVGQLAGGIAHDFNNLLQAIISYSEFLGDSIETGSPMQEDVGEIKKAAHRAAELTRQLLVFSRQDVSTPTVLDLNIVVSDAERLLRRTLGEDVEFTCTPTKAPCPVMADAAEMEMALMNLVINARDAMPRGGHLAVTVDNHAVEGEEATSLALPPGHYARVQVKDDGQGMPPEVAAKAFEPFFTTKETGRGTGLGLAMVYGITQRWGGTASIDTALGVGTTVSMLFPLSDEQISDEESEEPEPIPQATRREVVLLVEDQEGVRRSTARMLQSAGYEVLQAENAIQAAHDFETWPFDILVSDVIMPGGVTGKQLADRFRDERPGLRVVFISGHSAEAIAERGILPPGTNLLPKPFSPDQLLHAMAQTVDGALR